MVEEYAKIAQCCRNTDGGPAYLNLCIIEEEAVAKQLLLTTRSCVWRVNAAACCKRIGQGGLGCTERFPRL